jgi:hypothetical protein
VTRSGKRREREEGQGSLTVFICHKSLHGDQEWEERREKMGRESLTVLLLPQVTGD